MTRNGARTVVVGHLLAIAGLVGYVIGDSRGGGTTTVVREAGSRKPKSTLEKIEAESGLGKLQEIEEEAGLAP